MSKSSDEKKRKSENSKCSGCGCDNADPIKSNDSNCKLQFIDSESQEDNDNDKVTGDRNEKKQDVETSRL